ncbi:cellulase family glycosylhydrolase, partial [Tropicimonas marinistellae]|uniref:cellulase family glycosylhydrolase n=1 Tax=Tropicimonas marinistellae TaxID=1739787 RepID=UPI00082ABFA1
MVSVVYQAEDVIVSGSGYVTEQNNAAVEGRVASLNDNGVWASSGELRIAFVEAAGVYGLTLDYFDENDGEGTIVVQVNGAVVGRVELNEPTSTGGADATNMRSALIPGLELAPGDVVTIVGLADGYEAVRIDQLTFDSDSSTPGGSPILVEPIIDRARLPGDPFAFRLHPDTFDDPDGDPLALSVSLASGGDVPGWLTFDGTMFRGEAPSGFDGALDIRVTASDGTDSVDDVFTLTIGPDAPVLEFDVGRAINLGNALDAPNEGDWGYVIAEDHVQEIADIGFDSVRIAVGWSNHLDNNDIVDPAFFARVEEVIGWVLERDLNVVVDLHHFWEVNDDPDGYIPTLKTIWEQIATRFADMPSNVYFELFNEPHGAFAGDLVDETMAELVDIVRETNPTRAVIVGGEDWYTVEGLVELTLPNDDYIVPTFHYYVPFEFTHQGAPYVEDPPPTGREWGSNEDLQELAENFALIAEWREEQGDMPVFMGEFGAYFEIPNDERSEWTEDVREAADLGDIAWAFWAFHTIYDTDADAWNEPMAAALLGGGSDNSP